eukprot:TRINITY_DN121_c0_g1_i6.p1 TRINITY_DN121_c0_g1~~TRINITY_DN121_c0_g1_i6.p1  ORF type:complete len:170 (+),score=65.14 TRINITY_DN121_c0_g1_i6:79-588(+)
MSLVRVALRFASRAILRPSFRVQRLALTRHASFTASIAAQSQDMEETVHPDVPTLTEEEKKIILGNHPNDNAEDVLAAYLLPRDVPVPIIGPFGTRKRPVLIASEFDSRSVVCAGGNQNEVGFNAPHEPAFLLLKDDGKKHVCDQCGQVFKLLRLKPTFQDEHDGHHHH